MTLIDIPSSFVSDVLSRIDAVVQKKSIEKLAFFSGHDNTLEPLTMAYGVNNGHSPAYAALMRIELLDGGTPLSVIYSSQGNQGDLIRVYYDDTPLIFPGCGSTTCKYSIFKKISEQLVKASTRCNVNIHEEDSSPKRFVHTQDRRS